MAVDAAAADLPLPMVDASKGVLVVHCVGGDEIYTMIDQPLATASLVEAQKKGMLKRLELDTVFTNLNRASDFLFLAFMARWGTGDLHARIASRQSKLLRLCGDCKVTMDSLGKASTRVLWELLGAFDCLLKANEMEAIKNLSNCATHAKTMSSKVQTLAEGFKTLKNETMDDKLTAILMLGDQNAKNAKLRKDREDMEANRSKEAVMSTETNRKIQNLEEEIANEKAKGDVARERDLNLALVGFFAGAVRGLSQIVVDAMDPRTYVKILSEELDAAEALKSLEAWAKETAEGQSNRRKDLAAHCLALVKVKMEKEDQRRKALGDLAYLVSSLASSAKEVEVGECSREALEIAQWALTNFEVSLNSIKGFWDNMQRFCENLSTPEALEKIQDQIHDGNSEEERVEYYKSDRFVPIAITYICKWTALISVCGDHVQASAEVAKSVGDHILRSPNADEAKDLIKPLHARLQAEHEAAMRESDKNRDALNAAAKYLKIEAAGTAAEA